MKQLISNWKLSGSSLIYSLMISLLVSTLLSAYLMADFSYRGLVRRTYAEMRVQDNLRSAIVLALDEERQLGFEAFSYWHESDSIGITYENWGGYKLVHAKTRHQQSSGSLSALIGQKLPLGARSFVLSDEGYPLVLKGQTRIRGEIAVPQAEILTERYNGAAFMGSYPPVGKVKASRRLSQGDFPDIPWQIKRSLDSLSRLRLQDPLPYLLEEDIVQSWAGPVRRIQAQGRMIIRGGSYKGKLMLMARESIEIDAQAAMEDVILIAPTIKVGNGVRGRFQVFASDSLLLGDEVQLQFPSLLAVSAKPGRPSFLAIKTGCRIEGAVLFYQPIDSTTSSNLRPQVSIGDRSTVYGTLHVAGNLTLNGVVGGMVIAKGFVLRTAVGTVRNHLLNAQLLKDRLAPAYAGPFLFDKAETEVLQIYQHEKAKMAAHWE
ncbi:MAG: hypothetical protein AAFN10_15545 [Bacteroidota bacterium]